LLVASRSPPRAIRRVTAAAGEVVVAEAVAEDATADEMEVEMAGEEGPGRVTSRSSKGA
jgi:hypothetical protein